MPINRVQMDVSHVNFSGAFLLIDRILYHVFISSKDLRNAN
jgi:hypothetical protein